MRMINGVIYGILFLILLIWIGTKKRGQTRHKKSVRFVKQHGTIWLLLLVINTLSFCLTFEQEMEQIAISKEGYGGEEKQVEFRLEKEDASEEVALTVRPRILTDEALKEKWDEAFSYLEEHLKGENESLSRVDQNLDFSLDYEQYPFDVEFRPEDYILIDGEGNLKNDRDTLLAEGYGEQDFLSGIMTHVTVVLWYGERSAKHMYEVVVYPREEGDTERAFSGAVDYLKKREEKALYEDGFVVDTEVDGVHISRTEGNGISALGVLVLGGILIGLLLLREREMERQAEHRRKEQLLRCYPWFVNELVLLLGAGMQVKNIFATLIEEYEREMREESGKGRRGKTVMNENYKEVLIRELCVAKRSMELGISEEQTYYQLGRRLKLPCYIRIMTLLEQNVRKGTKGLSAAFEQEELQALDERKNLAKRYGEEAGTKLLGPMILLLLVVMLMIMIPAFMNII